MALTGVLLGGGKRCSELRRCTVLCVKSGDSLFLNCSIFIKHTPKFEFCDVDSVCKKKYQQMV